MTFRGSNETGSTFSRSGGRLPDMAVLMLTRYSSSALEQDAFNNGAYAVLQRPVDSNAINSLVTCAILRAGMLRPPWPSDPTPFEIQQPELTCAVKGFLQGSAKLASTF